MKPLIRNILIIAVLLGSIGVIIGIYLYNKKDPDLSKVKADFILQVSELVNEFNQDENSASAKYIDKVLEVKGPVSSIESASDSTMNIYLNAKNQMSGVNCHFDDVSSTTSPDIRKGDIITVRGVCSGALLMDVLLNNCVVVK
jgi:hypothetical protein